jgi:hypothetical protein
VRLGGKRAYVAVAGEPRGGRRGGEDVAGAERRRASHRHRHLEAPGKETTSEAAGHLVRLGICFPR